MTVHSQGDHFVGHALLQLPSAGTVPRDPELFQSFSCSAVPPLEGRCVGMVFPSGPRGCGAGTREAVGGPRTLGLDHG